MEMSKSSASDVILQGLLGRLCGYNANPNTIIYLHKKILNRHDLERYVKQMDGESTIVKNAKNISKKNNHGQNNLNDIIPIQLDRDVFGRLDGSEEISPLNMDKTTLVNLLKDAVNNRQISDLNEPCQQDEIRKQVNEYPENKFKIHRVKNNSGSSYQEVAKIIWDSRSQRVPKKLGSSCGLKKGELAIWLFHRPFPEHGIRRGDIFIDARTLCGSNAQNIPITTGKEVFSRVTEIGEVVESNGSYQIDIPADTAIDTNKMLGVLRELIHLSLQPNTTMTLNKYIQSIVNPFGFTGICVSAEVLNALNPGGRIHEILKQEFQVNIKIKKTRGPPLATIARERLTRLAEISWF